MLYRTGPGDCKTAVQRSEKREGRGDPHLQEPRARPQGSSEPQQRRSIP